MLKKMRFLFLTAAVAALVAACGGYTGDSGSPSSPELADSPGHISGLGDDGGELQGTPFSLPEGVTLTGAMEGLDIFTNVRSSSVISKTESVANGLPVYEALQTQFPEAGVSATARANGNAGLMVGSGFAVVVKFSLMNSNTTAKEIVFPAGLIIKPRASGYQKGVLLKKAKVTLPANSSRSVTLIMYCGNLGLMESHPGVFYEFAVVSNSSTLLDLINRVTDKKINFEEYADAELEKYGERVVKLTDLLWNLTNKGVALNEQDKAWLAALPNSR